MTTRRAQTTIPEKIDVIDSLIADYRWAKNFPGTTEHVVFGVLTELATDLRAREVKAVGQARAVLEQKVADTDRLALRSSTMIGLAQEVKRHWPTVRRALELMEEGAR